MVWVNLQAEIAAEFRSFGASVDADDRGYMTIFREETLFPKIRTASFVDQVATVVRQRSEWAAPELREALGVGHDPSATKRVGHAMRELGWGYRRKHGGLRIYRPLTAA